MSKILTNMTNKCNKMLQNWWTIFISDQIRKIYKEIKSD